MGDAARVSMAGCSASETPDQISPQIIFLAFGDIFRIRISFRIFMQNSLVQDFWEAPVRDNGRALWPQVTEAPEDTAQSYF